MAKEILAHPDTAHTNPVDTLFGNLHQELGKQIVKVLTKSLMIWLLNFQLITLTISISGDNCLKIKKLKIMELAVSRARQSLTEANCKEEDAVKLAQLYNSF